MSLSRRLNRLIDAGVAEAAGVSPATLAGYAHVLPDEPGTIVAVGSRRPSSPLPAGTGR